VAGGRSHQLLAHEFDGVGQGLKQALRSDVERAWPQLHVTGHLALHPDEDEGIQPDEGEHEHQPQDKAHRRIGEERKEGVHRSISGMTRSRLPRMDTASASIVPRASSQKRLKLENPGARSLTRYGLGPPSERTWTRILPRAPSTARQASPLGGLKFLLILAATGPSGRLATACSMMSQLVSSSSRRTL